MRERYYMTLPNARNFSLLIRRILKDLKLGLQEKFLLLKISLAF
jgi:hypothetical protein